MSSRVSHRRSGMSLIEMVIVISLTAVLSGLAVAGIAAMYGYDRSTRSQSRNLVSIVQMLSSLRVDIHRANDVEWDADEQLLQLDLPNATSVEYRAQAERWTRVEHGDEGPAITTSFGVSAEYRGECNQRQIAAGEVLRLHFVNQPSGFSEQQTKTERTYRYDVVAVVGRDELLVRN